MNQNGYNPQGMTGFGQPNTGYTTPQVPYAQAGNQQGFRPVQQNGFAPYSPMQTGQQNALYNMTGSQQAAQQGSNGSFIPQTPYSPGYTSPGYQPQAQGYVQQGYPQTGYPPQGGYAPQGGYVQQGSYAQQGSYVQQGYPPQGAYAQQGYPTQGGYAPGYNPYGQMGKTQSPQNNPGQDIPLNGGGYIPPKGRRQGISFELKDWHLIAAGIILIALFAAAVLILKNNPLKILLILLAVGSAGALWLKQLTAENKRLTYTILALVLCLVTAVSFVIRQPSDVTRNGTGTAAGSGSPVSGNAPESNGVPEIPEVPGNNAAANPTAETPAPQTTDGILLERLVTFFTLWSGNRQDEMLALCSPSWQQKQENPRTSLFMLIGNRIPKDCTPESISGTDADDSRRVTLTATIDRKTGKDPEKYRMAVRMTKENGEWFVDPQSLQSNETLETPDPNITPTPAPTATPAVFSNTVLYYNPNGGEYYHADQNCRNVGKKNLPLAGQFYYSELNDEPYSKLKPCNVCAAPLRQ